MHLHSSPDYHDYSADDDLNFTMTQRSDQAQSSPAATSAGTPAGTPATEFDHLSIRITTLNENWRGKNDPAERRRIQNRINQRAYRQRQRVGQSPQRYKPRSMSGPLPHQSEQEDALPPMSSMFRSHSEGRLSTELMTEPSVGIDTPSGPVWDELALLINRNLMSAATFNAQQLGIDQTALQDSMLVPTPRLREGFPPASLTPCELQYQTPHDPILDSIPHPRFRLNILQAIAAGQLDQALFTRSIRQSGALELLNGEWRRGGLVVWSSPEQHESWELSESFVRCWNFLLEGCEDLIAATNAWRSRRGDDHLSLSLQSSDAVLWE